eukprot:200506_1
MEDWHQKYKHEVVLLNLPSPSNSRHHAIGTIISQLISIAYHFYSSHSVIYIIIALLSQSVHMRSEIFTPQWNVSDLASSSVSIYNDTALIGDSFAYSDAGAVYVLERVNNEWVKTHELVANDSIANGYFGRQVSLYDNIAFIGAYEVSGNFKACAYVFERINQSWSQRAKLVPTNTLTSTSRNEPVHIHSKYGIIGVVNTQSAFIYGMINGDWKLMKKASPGGCSSLGEAVSIHDPYAIISGWSCDNAYVYQRHNQTWSLSDTLTPRDGAPGIQSGDLFGTAVAISDKYAVVSGSRNGNDRGAIYIFSNVNETWNETQKITGETEYSYYGRAVVIYREYLVVSSRYGNYDLDSFGKVYLYRDIMGEWVEIAQIIGPNRYRGDGFGWVVSIHNNHILMADSDYRAYITTISGLTRTPTIDPTIDPTTATIDPTFGPTINPTTATVDPTTATFGPTIGSTQPTQDPSANPSQYPTINPTNTPTVLLSTQSEDETFGEREASEETEIKATSHESHDDDNESQDEDRFTQLLDQNGVAIAFVFGICFVIVSVCVIYCCKRKRVVQDAEMMNNVSNQINQIVPSRNDEDEVDGLANDVESDESDIVNAVNQTAGGGEHEGVDDDEDIIVDTNLEIVDSFVGVENDEVVSDSDEQHQTAGDDEVVMSDSDEEHQTKR